MASGRQTNYTMVDPRKLEREIKNLHREPFKEVLQEWMEYRPKGLSVKRASENDPFKWVQGVQALAQLSGYHQKQTIEHTGEVLHRVQALSDVELQSQLEELQRELEAQKAIPGEFEEDETDSRGNMS